MPLANPAENPTLDKRSHSPFRDGSTSIDRTMGGSTTLEDTVSLNGSDISDDDQTASNKGKKRAGLLGLFRLSDARKNDLENGLRVMPQLAIKERRLSLKRIAVVFAAIVPTM